MPQQSHSMLKSKHLEHSSEEYELEIFSYIDLLNYMLKYKIPQIVTLTRINFRQSEQEESSVLYSSELCAELLYFCIERFGSSVC